MLSSLLCKKVWEKKILIAGEIVFRKKWPLLVISCACNEKGTDIQVCVTV